MVPKLPKKWTRAKIGDVADILTGGTPNRSEPKYWNGEIPWMSSGEIHGRQIENTAETITKVGMDASNARLLPINTVMVALNGQGKTRGATAIIRKPMTCNQSLAGIITDTSQLSPEYLFHYLDSRYNELRGVTGDDGRNGLNLRLLKNFAISLPPLRTQNHIVSVLSTVDEAIEATRAVIEQTRRLKTALLQDLLTNGLQGGSQKTKSAKFIPKYPASWRLTSLGEILREPIRNGYSPTSPKKPTGHWVTTLSCVSDIGYRRSGVKPAPTSNEQVLSSVLKRGDIIVSRSNTRDLVGLAGIYDGHPSPCSYSDLLMRVRIDTRVIDNHFALTWILSPTSRAYFKQTSRGTSGSMKKIDRGILENLPVPLPTMSEQLQIVSLNHSLDQRVREELDLLNHLKRAKSALSEGLLTGRIALKGRRRNGN